MRKEALFFTVFFLSASAAWLILSAVLTLSPSDPAVSSAARYAPEMARAALLSVPLSVAGGLIIDLLLRGK